MPMMKELAIAQITENITFEKILEKFQPASRIFYPFPDMSISMSRARYHDASSPYKPSFPEGKSTLFRKTG